MTAAARFVVEHWWIARDHRAALAARASLDVAAWMALASGGERLSSDRQSAAVRVGGDPPLLLKWRRPLRSRRRRHWLRPSRERTEARALRRATALGISTPPVWAVGERRRLGELLGAVLIRPFHEGVEPGDLAAARDPSAVEAMARALRGWHDRGFRHGDAWPKNMLLGGAGAAPLPIGCPVATFVSPGSRLDGRRLRDLARFAAGCRNLLGEADAFRFLAAYAESPGLPPTSRIEEAVRPRYARVLAKHAAREATRPMREPSGPPLPTPLPPDTPPAARHIQHPLDAI